MWNFSLQSAFKTAFLLLWVTAFVPLATSCEEKEGACEIKIRTASKNLFSCRNDSDDSGCSIEQSDVEKVFHTGKSCSSLGYNYKTPNGSFTSEDGSYDTPGENGAFQNDTGSGGIGGCTGSYDGPSFDIQIDSQCQAAYAYTCSGSADGVKATCSIYKAYQRDNPKIPDCPYCK